MLLFSFDGSFVFLFADATLDALLFQLPTRIPRDEPIMPPAALAAGPQFLARLGKDEKNHPPR